MEFSRLLRKPRKRNGAAFFRRGWDGRTRTCECQSQSLVPYRLATSQCFRQAGENLPVVGAPSPACGTGEGGFYGVSDGTRTHGLQSHNLTR